MPSLTLENIDKDRRRQTWHAIIALEAYTTRQHRVWDLIIAFGMHTRSDDVGHDILSLSLDRTHGGTISASYAIIALGQHIQFEKSGKACHHGPCPEHMVE